MKRIVGMILVVAMVASLVIVSVFAADTREDEMPATCIAEITESGEVIYYVEDEPKENDEATEPATWVADVDEDEEDSPIITRASDLILDGNLSDVETSRGSGSTSFRISRSQPYFRVAIKNNGSETLHASMCFGNKNAESFWDQDIPAGGSSKKVCVFHFCLFCLFACTMGNTEARKSGFIIGHTRYTFYSLQFCVVIRSFNNRF